ncbi:sigma-70 family RNA polymerase sigma factor [Olivibacter ginsenosidimutans]|uniref:sigma-70 family RNA polymerase sigma factor n=1 Tax=Olivibacter ginsenosidimutans TaxID=1176537 RepID=UPI003CD0AA00
MQRFEACLEKMPPKMRTIFEFSRTDHLSHQEISERLQISRDNVNRQIKNALIRLKKSLLLLFLIFFLP